MPPKKKSETDTTAKDEKKVVLIQRKSPMDWMNMYQTAGKQHWRKLHVTIQLREWMLAGKPAKLDAALAMMKARSKDLGVELQDHIEVVDIKDPNAVTGALEQAQDEGLCEFHRRDGKPGIWMPTNNFKAVLKENWSVLGYRMEHRGSRGAMAEGVFVASVQTETADPAERDWIYLSDKPNGVHTAVSHTSGPKGPVSSIKRHEFIVRPELTFELNIAVAIFDKLPDEALADTLFHFGEHGLGACRSQGYGKFDVVKIVELGYTAEAGVATQAG